MKTLINKANPQIRITAPEITIAHPPVSNEGYVYWIPAINEMYNPIDWTLVEEEPENISWADRLKKRLENMTQEEFEKAMNEMYIEGDESPTLEEKVEMYMKCDKKTLAEMLAMRDMIMEHKNPPQEPILTKTE